ncbi:MAG: hypothetical protein IFK91_01545 [Acidobacteria bacterium]|nr:hypothetical protein [Candidatus Sulfomarinibacter sp. MAG AM1]
MERAALELIDTGLQFVSSRGQLSQPSPGLALIDGDEVAVGLDAECSARLNPRRLHSRFWQELSTAPLGRPFPGYLRKADLAHAHLKAVWDAVGGGQKEVIIAVPGIYSNDQLGLLLGITRELAIPVRGLIDAAVAAAADREVEPHCLHLDLHLHRAVLTELEHGEEIVRTAVHTEPRVGLLGLRDIWARVIAQTFVRATRFDPLHLAATEQVLYAQLTDYLEALAEHDSTQVRIASGGRQHAVGLDRTRIVDAAQSAYDILTSLVSDHSHPEGATLLLSHRAAALPGLVDHLRKHSGLTAVVLHSAAAGGGALAHADRIRSPDSALPFVTRLPGFDARPPGPVTVPVAPPLGGARHLPTHLVMDGVAHRIESDPLILGHTEMENGADINPQTATVRRLAGQVMLDAPAEAGVTVNGEQLEGKTALAPGDRLRLGISDREILVVTMVE